MITCDYYLLNKLINKEFPGAYRQIVTHLQEVEFAVEDVQQAFDSMQAKVQNLDFIKSKLSLHPLTAQIAALSEERHQYLLSLRGRVVYAQKSPIAEERKAAETLNVWLNREHRSFSIKNMDHQNDAVHRMSHDLVLYPEMNTALATLGLPTIMDSLSEISSEMLILTVRRRSTRDAHTSKARKLRREAYLAMKALVMAIELAKVLNKGDDEQHFDCLKTINDVVTDFYSKHQSRISRKRNAAEAAKAAANQDAQPENDEQTDGNVVPMGGKLAPASRSSANGVQTPIDLDLQSGVAAANVAMKGATSAGNESVSTGKTHGVEPKTKHEGGDENESSDRVS